MLDHMGNDYLPSCSAVRLDETVGERKVFYRLGESEIFEYANKNVLINGTKMIDVVPRMVVADHGFLQISLSQFDKQTRYELFESARFKITCRKSMVQLLENGSVNMVYSDEYRLPTSLPYIVQTAASRAKVFVNITDFVEINAVGQVQVTNQRNYNALMAILFAACSAYRIVTAQSQLPSDLADGMVIMYANMLEKVINSLVHCDPVTRDKVRYLTTEFALVQMYGTEQGTKLFYRYKGTYFPKLTKMITEALDARFKVDSFDKLSFFIDELRSMYPSMKGLTLYLVYDKWIRTYGAATAMALDYFGFHLYTICMVLFESPLVTRMALEPVLDKARGAQVYKRLQAIIGSE